MLRDASLEGERALVTGASRGGGADVAVTAQSARRRDQTVERIEGEGTTTIARIVDGGGSL